MEPRFDRQALAVAVANSSSRSPPITSYYRHHLATGYQPDFVVIMAADPLDFVCFKTEVKKVIASTYQLATRVPGVGLKREDAKILTDKQTGIFDSFAAVVPHGQLTREQLQEVVTDVRVGYTRAATFPSVVDPLFHNTYRSYVDAIKGYIEVEFLGGSAIFPPAPEDAEN